MNPVNHVAIIMDGNGRWGLKFRNSRNAGHKAGLGVIEIIIKEAIKLNIKYLTLFAFSTENWRRPKKEINFLFNLLENFLSKRINDLHEQDIKIKFIGKKNFSVKLNKLLKETEIKTNKNNKLQINLAINYGSKLELVQSFKKLIKKKQTISEKNISENLYTKNIPDPDLLIRTGNTRRFSNFLLWQLAYSEIYFVRKLWPAFTKKDFKTIIKNFKTIKRNYGSI